MNKKQKINLAVWAIVIPSVFVVMLWGLLDSVPRFVWQTQSVMHVCMVRGMLSFVVALMWCVPFVLIHSALED